MRFLKVLLLILLFSPLCQSISKNKQKSTEKVLAILTDRSFESATRLIKLKLSAEDRFFLDKVLKKSSINMNTSFVLTKHKKNSYSFPGSKQKFSMRLKGKELTFKGRGLRYQANKNFKENFMIIINKIKPQISLNYFFLPAYAEDPLSGLDDIENRKLVNEALQISTLLAGHYYYFDNFDNTFQLIADATTNKALERTFLSERQISSISCKDFVSDADLAEDSKHGALIITYADGSQSRVTRSPLRPPNEANPEEHRDYFIDTWVAKEQAWKRTFDNTTYRRNAENNGTKLKYDLNHIDEISNLCKNENFNQIASLLRGAQQDIKKGKPIKVSY